MILHFVMQINHFKKINFLNYTTIKAPTDADYITLWMAFKISKKLSFPWRVLECNGKTIPRPLDPLAIKCSRPERK